MIYKSGVLECTERTFVAGLLRIGSIVYTVEPPTTDSPYYGNIHNADKRPRPRIIPYSLLYIATSV